MAVETRTVYFTVDPALRIYLAYLDTKDREFDLDEFDHFAAIYRAGNQPAATAPRGEGEGQ